MVSSKSGSDGEFRWAIGESGRDRARWHSMKRLPSQWIRILPRTLSKRRVLEVMALVLVALVAAVSGALLGPRVIGTDGSATPSAEPSSRPGTPPGFVEFRDAAVGFALSYPADWSRVDSPDPQVPLLVAKNPYYSFQARVLMLQKPIGPQELTDVKRATDQIVLSNNSVKMLADPERINLGGLPGYFYFYSFSDPATGRTGVHTHFFLFKDTSMIVLVFQSEPSDQFRGAAGAFDKITESFRVL